MVFSSLVFLFIFLPVVLLFYYFVKEKYRNTLLLLASIIFFAWGGVSYTLILITSIFANYFVGLLINKQLGTKMARYYLALGITINIGILAIFKYANFFIENINDIFINLNIEPVNYENIVLPIGISFYTFQALSYIIDVYRKETEVQKSLTKLALFISLFPQLIAGPIVRYHDINKQLSKRYVNFNKFTSGTERFIIGLGKKVLIANTFALVVDEIFAIDPANMPGIVAWLGVILYAFQIYFDFSGYSDMAIGLGRMFGFDLLENFNFPYIARSIQEFWRRWHISLSTWFRDYLYIPLGGNRVGKHRVYFNLFIVFLLTGFWHGASWNFIVWGLFHGMFLVIERIGFGRFLEKLWSPVRHFYTLFVILISWVFFRADDLPYAISYLKTMFGIREIDSELWMLNKYLSNDVMLALIVALLGSTTIFIFTQKYFIQQIKRISSNFIKYSVSTTFEIIAALGLISILFLSILFLTANSYNPFIYFRF